MRSVLLVAAVGALVGCGPAVGLDCSPEGGGACEDNANALLCTGGKFVRWSCPGELGCAANNKGIVCDVRGSSEGGACGFKGSGFCSSSRRFVECITPTNSTSLYWTGRDCATSCEQTGLTAICR